MVAFVYQFGFWGVVIEGIYVTRSRWSASRCSRGPEGWWGGNSRRFGEPPNVPWPWPWPHMSAGGRRRSRWRGCPTFREFRPKQKFTFPMVIYRWRATVTVTQVPDLRPSRTSAIFIFGPDTRYSQWSFVFPLNTYTIVDDDAGRKAISIGHIG